MLGEKLYYLSWKVIGRGALPEANELGVRDRSR
jgi:hypothetical protein